MADHDYVMREYVEGDLPRVADLQRQLLGEDVAANLAYLDWKYHQHPQSPRPWAIVAEHPDDGIVGFRGFVPSFWRHGETGRVLPLLALADTCVDVGHRRRGLFTSMTRASLERFEKSEFRGIINLSTSAAPAPGYVKMGWHVFGNHGALVRMTARGLLGRFVPGLAGRPGPCEVRRAGLEGSVQDAPDPQAMADVVAGQVAVPRLQLLRDREFYAWRFGNVREQYRFALARRDGRPTAFVVLRTEGGPGQAVIIDYAETTPGGLDFLVDLLLGAGGYGSLSVWDTSPQGADTAAWRGRGFRSLEGVKKFLGRAAVPMPLLVRPLAPEPGQEDWRPDGHDLRDPRTWNITEICSDGS